MTMRKAVLVLLAVMLVATVASSVVAATWYKVGTSAFSNPGLNNDSQRIKMNSIAVDGNGNIYATACNGNNDGTSAGTSSSPGHRNRTFSTAFWKLPDSMPSTTG